jgi:UDP-2-acetamido-3-amino-2,3-dideoxy-glucuronate N-acetyltransferase
MDYFKHETAIVDEGAKIGAGTRVWHWVHICGKGVSIGKKCNFGQNVFIGNNVSIGNNVKIQNNVSVYDSVTLEDDVFCGPSMVFTNVINPRSAIERKHEYKSTLVKKGASIGANATVICGNTVGSYAFIAAGAVVSKNVKNYALVAGVPARQIGWMCECGERLPEGEQQKVVCSACDKHYVLDEKEELNPC